jgi:hypothetical protein
MVRFCFRAKASSYNNNVVDLGIKDFRNDEHAGSPEQKPLVYASALQRYVFRSYARERC